MDPAGYCYLQWFRDLGFRPRKLSAVRRKLGAFPRITQVLGTLYAECDSFDRLLSGYTIHNNIVHVSAKYSRNLLRDLLEDFAGARFRVGAGIEVSTATIAAAAGIDVEAYVTDIIVKDLNDKTSSTRTNIVNFVKDKQCKSKHCEKLCIKQALSVNAQLDLAAEYPEFNLDFQNSFRHGHANSAAARCCATQLCLQRLNYMANQTFPGYAVVVKDVGGNYILHIGRSRFNVHCCCPILCARDSNRESERQTTLSSCKLKPEMRNALTNRVTRRKLWCDKKAQYCAIKARYCMFVHSSYDMTGQEMADAMSIAGSVKAYGCVLFDPKMLLGEKTGTIPFENAYWNIYTAKGGSKRIRFSFVDDSSMDYDHDLETYLTPIKKSFIKDSDNQFYSIELKEYRLGSQFFQITKMQSKFIPRGQHSHKIWLNRKGMVMVKYYTWEPRGNSNDPEICMRQIAFLAPHDLVNETRQWAYGLQANKFTVNSIFEYMKAINSRIVVNGVSVTKSGARMDADKLYTLAHAIYAETYIKRYNTSTVMSAIIDDIKNSREPSSLFSKLISAMKESYRNNFGMSARISKDGEYIPEDGIMIRLHAWMEKPSKFPFGIEDSVQFLEYIEVTEDMENIELPTETIAINDEVYDVPVETIYHTAHGLINKITGKTDTCTGEFDVVEMPKDGACLYHAFAQCVQDSLVSFRLAVSKHLSIFENAERIKSDLRLECNGNSDKIELFAREYGCTVCVHWRDSTDVTIFGAGDVKYHLLYTPGHISGHYDFLKAVKRDTTSCLAAVTDISDSETSQESTGDTVSDTQTSVESVTDEDVLDEEIHLRDDNLKREIDSIRDAISGLSSRDFIRNRDYLYRISSTRNDYPSRSSMKLLEILENFNIGLVDKALDLAGAPGGFASHLSRLDIPLVVTTTLVDGPGYDYAAMGAGSIVLEHESGDLTDHEQNSRLVSHLITEYGGFDLITADGAIPCPGRENEQEIVNLPLIRGEIDVACACLNPGGGFVLKVFELFTKGTRDVITTLVNRFARVVYYKPVYTKITSSEAYLICIGFGEDRQTALADLAYSHANRIYDQVQALRRVIEMCQGRRHNPETIDFYAHNYKRRIGPVQLVKINKQTLTEVTDSMNELGKGDDDQNDSHDNSDYDDTIYNGQFRSPAYDYDKFFEEDGNVDAEGYYRKNRQTHYEDFINDVCEEEEKSWDKSPPEETMCFGQYWSPVYAYDKFFEDRDVDAEGYYRDEQRISEDNIVDNIREEEISWDDEPFVEVDSEGYVVIPALSSCYEGCLTNVAPEGESWDMVFAGRVCTTREQLDYARAACEFFNRMGQDINFRDIESALSTIQQDGDECQSPLYTIISCSIWRTIAHIRLDYAFLTIMTDVSENTSADVVLLRRSRRLSRLHIDFLDIEQSLYAVSDEDHVPVEGHLALYRAIPALRYQGLTTITLLKVSNEVLICLREHTRAAVTRVGSLSSEEFDKFLNERIALYRPQAVVEPLIFEDDHFGSDGDFEFQFHDVNLEMLASQVDLTRSLSMGDEYGSEMFSRTELVIDEDHFREPIARVPAIAGSSNTEILSQPEIPVSAEEQEHKPTEPSLAERLRHRVRTLNIGEKILKVFSFKKTPKEYHETAAIIAVREEEVDRPNTHNSIISDYGPIEKRVETKIFSGKKTVKTTLGPRVRRVAGERGMDPIEEEIAAMVRARDHGISNKIDHRKVYPTKGKLVSRPPKEASPTSVVKNDFLHEDSDILLSAPECPDGLPRINFAYGSIVSSELLMHMIRKKQYDNNGQPSEYAGFARMVQDDSDTYIQDVLKRKVSGALSGNMIVTKGNKLKRVINVLSDPMECIGDLRRALETLSCLRPLHIDMPAICCGLWKQPIDKVVAEFKNLPVNYPHRFTMYVAEARIYRQLTDKTVKKVVSKDKSLYDHWDRHRTTDNEYHPRRLQGHTHSINAMNSMHEQKELWRVKHHYLKIKYDAVYQGTRDMSKDVERKLVDLPEGYGLWSARDKRWIITPKDKRDKYECGYDGSKFVKLCNSDSPCLLVGKSTELMQDERLYKAVKDMDIDSLVLPDMKLTQGVPGCGKTTYILKNAILPDQTRAGDLVLFPTREGATDFRKRIAERFQGPVPTANYRTLHSYLLDPVATNYDRLIIDEALMMHAGEIMFASLKARCKSIIMVGDQNQIPYINRMSQCEVKYSDPMIYSQVGERLSVSYRCTRSAAVLFSKDYEGGMFSRSSIVNEIEFHENFQSIVDVPRIENAQYLVFKQSEKHDMERAGFKVSTIHEFQGKQADTIVLVRLSRKVNEEIFMSFPHVLVAMTRHKKKFIYCTPIRSDLTSRYVMTEISPNDVIRCAPPMVGGGPLINNNFVMQRADREVIDHENIWTCTGKYQPADVAPMIPVKLYSVKPLNFYRPHVDQNAIYGPEVLQAFYDKILPGNSLVQNDYDSYNVHVLYDLNIHLENTVIKPSKFKPYNQPIFDRLHPTIRTSIEQSRSSSQIETLLAMVKRNQSVPELMGLTYEDALVEDMYNTFINTYFSKDRRELLLRLNEYPIVPNSWSISDWLDCQKPNVVNQIAMEKPLEQMDLTEYEFMIKSKAKPQLDTGAPYSYAALQTIAYQSKDINATFCPIFREIKRRLLHFLDDRFLLNCDIAPEEFAEQLTQRFNPSEIAKLKKLEIDISKYDKSQGKVALEFELKIMALFGVPKHLCDLWRVAHEATTLKDRANGVKMRVNYQRKSGDASTYLGNTIFLMAVVAMLFDLSDCKMALFSGDDSLIVGGDIDYDRNALCADLFNLESKFFRSYDYMYFCSKFIIATRDRFYFVPDPVKILTKLGRKDLVNWEHVEEYRTSLVDLTADFGNSLLNYPLSHAVAERYKFYKDMSLLFACLYHIINNKEEFHSLYYTNPGERLCLDPSRPNLN